MRTVAHDSELVMVPVPVRLYPAVVRLIADHHAANGLTVGPGSDASTRQDSANLAAADALGRPGWSQADYAKIALYLNTFSRAVLDLCSRTPGAWVAYRDAVKAGGVSHFSARSQLGGLTRRVRLILGREDWPFECEMGPGADRQIRFRLSEAAAAAWKAGFVRGECA